MVSPGWRGRPALPPVGRAQAPLVRRVADEPQAVDPSRASWPLWRIAAMPWATRPVSASRHRDLRYTAGTVPIGVITFDFDPLLRLGDDVVVRWQAVALAVVFLMVLVVVALVARRRGLRSDDLLSITVGAVPGAVVGGRIGYLLVHPDAFAAGPHTFIEPTVGGLELATAVVGGLLTGAYVAVLLGASVRAWARVVAIPLLIALAAGKLAMVLGGSGQGLPTDHAWATAYVGPGPWGSLAPELASHPSQVYEAAGTLAVAVILVMVIASGAVGTGGRIRTADGRLLLLAIAGWAVVRTAVSTTWRDPLGPGPLPAGGWLALAVAGGAIALVMVDTWLGWRKASAGEPDPDAAVPDWPDPAMRPRF
jgi:phosphatidylglycerol---prolipoprotein diacylglyceryl transferase